MAIFVNGTVGSDDSNILLTYNQSSYEDCQDVANSDSQTPVSIFYNGVYYNVLSNPSVTNAISPGGTSTVVKFFAVSDIPQHIDSEILVDTSSYDFLYESDSGGECIPPLTITINSEDVTTDTTVPYGSTIEFDSNDSDGNLSTYFGDYYESLIVSFSTDEYIEPPADLDGAEYLPSEIDSIHFEIDSVDRVVISYSTYPGSEKDILYLDIALSTNSDMPPTNDVACVHEFTIDREDNWSHTVSNLANGEYVEQELNSVKTSVSNGKSAIASAITGKGVSTSGSDSFATMATNIGNIQTGFNFEKTGACYGITKTGVSVGANSILAIDGSKLSYTQKSSSWKTYFAHPTDGDDPIDFCVLDTANSTTTFFCYTKTKYWVFSLNSAFTRTDISSGTIPTNTNWNNSVFRWRCSSYNGDGVVIIVGSYRYSSSHLYYYGFGLNLNSSKQVTRLTSVTLYDNTSNSRNNLDLTVCCVGKNNFAFSFSAENTSSSTALCLHYRALFSFTYTTSTCTISTTSIEATSNQPYDVYYLSGFKSNDDRNVIMCCQTQTGNYPSYHTFWRRKSEGSSTFTRFGNIAAARGNYVSAVHFTDFGIVLGCVASSSSTNSAIIAYNYDDENNALTEITVETSVINSTYPNYNIIFYPVPNGFIAIQGDAYNFYQYSEDRLNLYVYDSGTISTAVTYSVSSTSTFFPLCVQGLNDYNLFVFNSASTNYMYRIYGGLYVKDAATVPVPVSVIGTTDGNITSSSYKLIKTDSYLRYTH